MKTCVIIAGGEFFDIQKNIIFPNDFVIACDKGYDWAKRLEINVNLVLGDFDSVASKIDDDVQKITLQKEKDDTDTMFAVKYAIKNGFENIKIIFAFGNRFDHSFANIQTGAFAVENGVNATLFGKNETVYIIKDTSIEIERQENAFLSVFSLSDYSYGVNEVGLKYIAKDATWTNKFPIGISNEWTSEKAKISVKKGVLAVILQKELSPRADDIVTLAQNDN